jgi:pimeloyl-ACP methyl ester carboxylesterase
MLLDNKNSKGAKGFEEHYATWPGPDGEMIRTHYMWRPGTTSTPLVFLGGGSSSALSNCKNALLCAQPGQPIIVAEHLVHGKNKVAPYAVGPLLKSGRLTPLANAQAIQRLLSVLPPTQAGDSFDVVGFSYGGGIAAMLLSIEPRIRRAVLLAPFMECTFADDALDLIEWGYGFNNDAEVEFMLEALGIDTRSISYIVKAAMLYSRLRDYGPDYWKAWSVKAYWQDANKFMRKQEEEWKAAVACDDFKSRCAVHVIAFGWDQIIDATRCEELARTCGFRCEIKAGWGHLSNENGESAPFFPTLGPGIRAFLSGTQS